MTARRSIKLPHSSAATLSAIEGHILCSGSEAMLKGVLETEREIGLVIGTRHEPFEAIFELTERPGVQSLLRDHGTIVRHVGDPSRAVTLATQAARSGISTLLLVADEVLPQALDELHTLTSMSLDAGAGFGLLLEDRPGSLHRWDPLSVAESLELVTIQPGNLSELRDGIDQLFRLSRADTRPAAMILHHMLLSSGATIEAHPNREAGIADVLLTRARRRSRWTEVRDVMRMARRMEMNHVQCLPSPGEVVPIGFVTIGPAHETIQQIAQTLRLVGRIPILQLRLLRPIDSVSVARFLSRCEQVVVLEPRPGAHEPAILRVAQEMRRRGESAATVWGRSIPHESAESQITLCNDEVTHPSILVRRILHLLHTIRPTLQVSERLTETPRVLESSSPERSSPSSVSAATRRVRKVLTDVDQQLRKPQTGDDAAPIRIALAIDGQAPSGSFEKVIPAEIWTAPRFIRSGSAAVRQAARERSKWIILVFDFGSRERVNIERMARGSVPDEVAERTRIVTARLSDLRELRDSVLEATTHDGLSIILLKDDEQPHYDEIALERKHAEIDRTGFEPLQRIVRPIEDAAAWRTTDRERDAAEEEMAANVQPLQSQWSAERNPKRFGSRIRARVQPMLEQIDIVRTRPPTWAWKRLTDVKLEIPIPIHRQQHAWRAHLAGFRGDPPGVAATALVEAGRLMGYDVAWVTDTSRIGGGLRAWSEIHFTRPAAGDGRHLRASPVTPFGESDLLIGLDPLEVLRAIDHRRSMRVASPQRTYVVLNRSASSREMHVSEVQLLAQLERAAAAVTRSEQRRIEDFSALGRRWFYTDRVADLLALGAAYQQGLIPVTVEAIETAIVRLETQGIGRAREAFSFGRYITADSSLLMPLRESADGDLGHLMRRAVLSLRSRRFGRRSLSARFRSLLERSLNSMPGLGETTAGRQALNDFVIALHRCLAWGGIEYAERYAMLVMNLYRADRGETGRALTREAILPLAEAMLIRDPTYLAALASGLEQRRRLRRRYNVKAARGDRIERRFLTRLEMTAFGSRFRADIRTSDWIASVVGTLGAVLPERWRGTSRERELRAFVIALIQRAAWECSKDYGTWVNLFRRLHLQAREDRLREMAMSELRMLTTATAIEPIAGASIGKEHPMPRRKSPIPAAIRDNSTSPVRKDG